MFKVAWTDVAMLVGGALLARHGLRSSTGDTPEPTIREKFAPVPVPVYVERVLWQLTRDCDPKKIRLMRNLLNERYKDLEECYRYQMPSDEVAKRVESFLTGQVSSIVPTPEGVSQASLSPADIQEP